MAKRKEKRQLPSSEEEVQASGEGAQPSPEEAVPPSPEERPGRKRRFIPKPETKGGALVELAVIVALAVAIALALQAWVLKPYQIPSESMEPTLDVGQRVLVNRFIYHFQDPQIGDVVVFHPPIGADNGQECGVPGGSSKKGEPCPKPTPEPSDQNFIKRIVAGPGDTLALRSGHPVVNGVEQKDEPFINPCGGGPPCTMPKEITIPPDYYFMMGDNRGASDDSRFWGPIPRDWIIGKAFFTYWPPNRLGGL